MSYEQNKARKQKAAVEAIEQLGGRTGYVRAPLRSPVMRLILGDDSYGNVEGVSFQSTLVTDAGLVHLTGLTKLEALTLDSTQVADAGLASLAELKGLTYLSLRSHTERKGVKLEVFKRLRCSGRFA